MKLYRILLPLIVCLYTGCAPKKPGPPFQQEAVAESAESTGQVSHEAGQEDRFTDSTSVKQGHQTYLLKIERMVSPDAVAAYASLHFYFQHKNEWVETSSFPPIELMDDSFYPSLKDYNGDGVNDLQLSIGSGMRGGNELFYLFITDTLSHQLVKLKGADRIVNPLYDSSTGGIVSMLLVGTGSIFSDYVYVKPDSIACTTITELWVERGITFQRKTMFSRRGNAVRVLNDSLRDNGEHAFSPW